MQLHLTKKESEVFYDFLASELKCVINEYDPDTCRKPSAKRISSSHHAESALDKWRCTQPVVQATNLVNLSNVKACDIELSKQETAYAKNLISKGVKDLRKELEVYPKPYQGMLKEFAATARTGEAIVAKLTA